MISLAHCLLATLFTSTSVLTLDAYSNGVCLCSSLRPASPLPQVNLTGDGCQTENGTYCPIPPGPFALSQRVAWGQNRELTTLSTRLRAVDPNSQELMCLEVETTPLDGTDRPYRRAEPLFWATVGLAIAYWAVIGAARLVSAWNRGINKPGKGIWGRARSAGYILASALSGERLAASPSLMRFCTPSMRDIIFHTQWCSALAMVSVQWPEFICTCLWYFKSAPSSMFYRSIVTSNVMVNTGVQCVIQFTHHIPGCY